MNTPLNTPPVDTRHRTRNRWMLGLLFGLFFGAMFVAAALRFSGWRPEGMKNKGELLQPYGDLRDVAPRLADLWHLFDTWQHGDATMEWPAHDSCIAPAKRIASALRPASSASASLRSRRSSAARLCSTSACLSRASPAAR